MDSHPAPVGDPAHPPKPHPGRCPFHRCSTLAAISGTQSRSPTGVGGPTALYTPLGKGLRRPVLAAPGDLYRRLFFLYLADEGGKLVAHFGDGIGTRPGTHVIHFSAAFPSAIAVENKWLLCWLYDENHHSIQVFCPGRSI